MIKFVVNNVQKPDVSCNLFRRNETQKRLLPTEFGRVLSPVADNTILKRVWEINYKRIIICMQIIFLQIIRTYAALILYLVIQS